MAITAAICNSYKQELLSGLHAPADVYKIALFTSLATLNKNTTAYSATNEATGLGYTAGGNVLTGFTTSLSVDTAVLDFTTDPTWPTSTLTARGALIYNSSKGNAAVGVLDFGSDITSTADLFTVQMPVADAANGLIRIA